jgi:hypothetical protein
MPLAGCRKTPRLLGKSLADIFVVIPAKAGTQQFLRFMDSGSSLRCGRDDNFRWQGGFFSSLLDHIEGSNNCATLVAQVFGRFESRFEQ